MTKKHYNRIAKEYNSMLQGEGLKYSTAKSTFNNMVNMLAHVLEDDNPRFNKQRFFNAVYADYMPKDEEE